MSEALHKTCPRCGANLEGAQVDGLCARCLGSLNFSPDTAVPGEETGGFTDFSHEDLEKSFPQLEILEVLGRGGMGIVYKARQKELGRLVALKLLPPERVVDSQFAERFRKEAQLLASLNHPHIVAIHDFGQTNGVFYLLMEFVDGVSLRQAMNAGRFTPDQALAIVPPVCEALQFAHEHGIVHRDIKPENLLLDKRGQIKIADFGIAKMLGQPAANADLLESQPAGTPQYMAPEQQRSGRTDHRADIYSLGVVLYEMLTGELPGSRLQPPLRRLQIDLRIDEIVLRALESSPDRRYQTAGELNRHVSTMLTSPRGPAATRSTPVRPFSRSAVIGAAWIPASLAALAFAIVWLADFPNPFAMPGLLQWLVLAPAVVLIVTGPFGTTILGWRAIAEILRSRFQVRGFPLALFDALVYPLLFANAGLVLVVRSLVGMLIDLYANPSGSGRSPLSIPVRLANGLAQNSTIWGAAGLIVLLAANLLIVAHVARRWTAAPLDEQPLGNVSAVDPRTRRWATLAIYLALAGGISGMLSALNLSSSWISAPFAVALAAVAVALAFPLRGREIGQNAIIVATLSTLMWPMLAVVVGITRSAGTTATSSSFLDLPSPHVPTSASTAPPSEHPAAIEMMDGDDELERQTSFLKRPAEAKLNVSSSPKFDPRVFVYGAETISGTVVEHNADTQEVVLNVGLQDGVRFGYAFQIGTEKDPQRVAVVKVLELDKNRCIAKVVFLSPASTSLKGLTAIATTPRPEKNKINVETRVGTNVWHTESLENKIISELLDTADPDARILIVQEKDVVESGTTRVERIPAPLETDASDKSPRAELVVSDVQVKDSLVLFVLHYQLYPFSGKSLQLAYVCPSEADYQGPTTLVDDATTVLTPFVDAARKRFSTPAIPLPFPDRGLPLAIVTPSAEHAQRFAKLLSDRAGQNLIKFHPLTSLNLLDDGTPASEVPEATVSDRPFRLDVSLKATTPRVAEPPETKVFHLQQLLGRNAIPVLQLFLENRQGQKAKNWDHDHSIVATAPRALLSRVQTSLAVMDDNGTIDPEAADLEDPRAELRRFFLVCAIENRGAAISKLVSAGVLAELQGDDSESAQKYRKTGLADPTWEAKLRGDWLGKQEALQSAAEEWNRYALIRLDMPVSPLEHGRGTIRAVFDGAPKASYTLRVVERRGVDGPSTPSYYIDCLPPWWEPLK